MWTGIFSIGSSIVTGISDYFKGKQEISKVQLEADKKLILAEAEAKAETDSLGDCGTALS